MSWTDPEQKVVFTIDPQQSRRMGLLAAEKSHWGLALIRLNEAARGGILDVELLDALGEDAYQKNVPEALSPYQNYYKYPLIATHMARAFLMLGDLKSAKEFLGYAKDSPLKAALYAMTEMGSEISKTAAAMLPVGRKFPELHYPEYWRALAAVADAAGDEELTQLAERRSKASAYKDPNIHFNQALRMLGKCEFRAGWRLYEWRLVPGVKNPNRTQLGKMPMWEGEKLKGRSLLIFGEQGLGDVIFGMRYIKPLLAEGVRLEIVARKPILPLLQAAYPEIKLHDEDEVAFFDYWDKVPSPDFWTYALSIPHRANLWRPINTGAFLAVPQDLLIEASQIVQKANPQNLPVYTINWHGRIDTESDRTRAFTVEEFAKVSGILNSPCLVISVQKDATPKELVELENLISTAGGAFLNAAPFLNSFAQTAAFISHSQRLLTCDTSVAHVGGAIGHPTTVLARNKAIWQWVRKNPEAVKEDDPSSWGLANQSVHDPSDHKEDDGAPSVWYDSITVKYALAPKISWLFTSFENKLEKKEKQHEQRLDERSNQHESSDSNDSSKSAIRPIHHEPSRQRRPLPFAGRNSTCTL